MTTLKLCILGGTGFVGKRLCARLARDGHRVTVLTRRRERHRDLLVLPKLVLTEADVHDPKVLRAEFAGMDAVINLVGILNARDSEGRDFYHVHVALPRKIVEGCRESGVKRLLHMSALGADAAYGRSQYQRTKGEGENLVHASVDLHVTSFRPSVIFGPGDSLFTRFATLLRYAPYYLPVACPQSRLQPVYVGDVAEAYAWSLTRHASFGQRYDLCGPTVYTLRALVEFTARTLALKRRVVELGPGLSGLHARLLEHAPGKLFSWDNYLSLQTDNICRDGFPPFMGIVPAAIEGIVPGYLREQ